MWEIRGTDPHDPPDQACWPQLVPYGTWSAHVGYGATVREHVAATLTGHDRYDMERVFLEYLRAIDDALPRLICLHADQLWGPAYAAGLHWGPLYPHTPDGVLDIGAIIRRIDVLDVAAHHPEYTLKTGVTLTGVSVTHARNTP